MQEVIRAGICVAVLADGSVAQVCWSEATQQNEGHRTGKGASNPERQRLLHCLSSTPRADPKSLEHGTSADGAPVIASENSRTCALLSPGHAQKAAVVP